MSRPPESPGSPPSAAPGVQRDDETDHAVADHAAWPPESAAAEILDPDSAAAVDPSAEAGDIAEHAAPPIWATETTEEAGDTAEALSALSPERLRSVVESLLFAAERPLTVQRIVELLEETASAPRDPSGPPLYQSAQVKDVLTQLGRELQAGGRGIELHEVAGGWQLRTAAQNAPWVQRLLQAKPVRLSRAQLETMAIVAYRQPVTRPEIDDIRGVDSGGALKTLLERQMVRVLGKKEEPGRPLLYGTTREFLEFFNLRDLKDLPTLREYNDLTDENREKMRALGHEPPLPGAVPAAEPVVGSSAEVLTGEGVPATAEAAPAVGVDATSAAGVDAAPAVDDAAHPAPPPAAPGEPASDAAAPGATFFAPRELIDKQLADDAEQLAKIDEMIRAVNTAFPLLDPTLLGMVADGTLPPPPAPPSILPSILPIGADPSELDELDESAADDSSNPATEPTGGDDREPEEL